MFAESNIIYDPPAESVNYKNPDWFPSHWPNWIHWCWERAVKAKAAHNDTYAFCEWVSKHRLGWMNEHDLWDAWVNGEKNPNMDPPNRSTRFPIS